jgi:hypothetical protein
MPYIGHSPTQAGSFVLLDDLEGTGTGSFNGSTVTFNLKVDSVSVSPKASSLIVSLDGVIQQSPSSYTTSGSTIVFDEAPAANMEFYGMLMGQSSSIGAGTITLADMASNSIDSDQYVNLSIDDAHVATGLDAVKIADGTVTNAELQYINTLSSNAQTQIGTKSPIASPTFTGTPLAPTASASTNTTQLATTAFVRTEVTNLIDSAPSALDTLNELAAALGDDASFSTTVTNSIATKLPLAGGAMTGAITTNSTFDGIDIAVRDAILTSTTTTAGAALPKAGGTMTDTLNITKASTTDSIKFTRTATSNNNIIKFASAGADKWIVGQRNDSTEHFRFYSYGTSSDVLSILTDGNVGIGQTSPASSHGFGPGLELRGEPFLRFEESGGSTGYEFVMNSGTDKLRLISTTSGADVFNITPTTATFSGDLKTSGGRFAVGSINATSQSFFYGSSATDTVAKVNSGSGQFTGTSLIAEADRSANSAYYVFKCRTTWSAGTGEPNTTPFSVRGDGLVSVNGSFDVTGTGTFSGKLEIGSTTGNARLSTGNSVSSPPYQFVNDSNSGMYRAADGQPAIAGYGVEIARFIPANNDSTYAEMALRSERDSGQGCKIKAYTTTDTSDFAEILFTRNGSSETGMQFIVHNTGNSAKTTHFYYNGDVYNPSNSTAWQTSSDIRIKKDINDLTGAVDILKQIRPVSYKFKKAWTDQKGLEYDNVRNGFIANEYKDVFPNAVKADTNPFKVGSETYDDFLSLDTEDLVPYLVKAVQEMSAKIEALEKA